jgi:hypothetical protein
VLDDCINQHCFLKSVLGIAVTLPEPSVTGWTARLFFEVQLTIK